MTLTVSVDAAPAPAAAGSKDRIEALDILRGIALLGMFLVHFNDQAVAGGAAPALAKLYQKTVTLFFEERFWTMFGNQSALGAGLALFAVNAATSRWWLERFRFGPVEWVWRSVTYGHRPQMRLAS